jgi:quercetin dioxygenase-like cupin family protein
MVVGLAVTAAAQNAPSIVTMANSNFSTPPGSPSCVTAAVQHGNPSTGASVMLTKLQSGCLNPWHWHTTNESIVVVSGSGKLEMKDEAPRNLTTGDYFYMPSQHAHQFTCASTCTLSTTSESARDVHYIDKDGKEISLAEALRLAGQPIK